MQEKKESNALLIGAAANIFMAVLAWFTVYYSNSEAILLDGNYSFIMFLGVLVALKIVAVRANRTKTFPFGKFYYESLYGFIKGLMILGVLIMSVTTAVIRITFYFTGYLDNIPMLIPEPILHYALICAVICYIVSFYYFQQNRKFTNKSILLRTEQKSAFVDGTLSLGIGFGVFLFSRGGEIGFIPYLADSFFVLVLASMLIKEPLTIIRESIIELAGGALQDDAKRKEFETIITLNMPETLKIENIFISKNGSKYIIFIYISTDELVYNKKDIITARTNITNILSKNHPYLSINIIPDGHINV
ncbi:cation diffusion facilitator family transporter [Methanococcus vannielii SB]|uniref:Cation diffusion facilitator family transporter n=1 Tax=Methanococcus vannielii (strain ATCC 35089 / DSM 1224 / JCM 13029 / OCM 148 / SB) TaxID=406327 RepID=A6UNW8_METVS|nr:cation transporter [Methanococcus vannielii]ABR54190.1 cation diffusion facilitator family transporter [Methanococcus vannielii SB]